jgi:hypothetical protein
MNYSRLGLKPWLPYIREYPSGKGMKANEKKETEKRKKRSVNQYGTR